MGAIEKNQPEHCHHDRRNVSRMPVWIRQSLGEGKDFGVTARAIRDNDLHTVCEEARCPNRGECWSRGTATFMLLGDTCTRACGFCSVKTGRGRPVDEGEPGRVLEATRRMGLRYVVLTSVNRDDIRGGGAGIFASTVRALWQYDATLGIELLTPDFYQGENQAIEIIGQAAQEFAEPHRDSGLQLVWGHNIEMVPRLYRQARKGSDYRRSLSLLSRIAALPGVQAKSAIMLGLGETRDEVLKVFRDLREAGVSRLSIGQYLRPGLQQLPVAAYLHPHMFRVYEDAARTMGFAWVKAGPLVRSSYHAEEVQG